MQEVQNVSKTVGTVKRQILVVSGHGRGKTFQFRTLAGKKFIYLFDPNGRDALGDDDIDYMEFIPEITDLNIAAKTLKKEEGKVVGDPVAYKKFQRSLEPKTYINFEADFEERLDSGYFDQYDWVGFDSLTTLSEIVMDRVLYLAGRPGKHPEQPDYTSEMTTIKNIFRAASGMKGLYVTAHTEVDKEEVTGKVYARLLVTGKNRGRLPLRFAHIFALECSSDGKYEMITVPDRMHPVVRTSLDLPSKLDVTCNRAASLIGQGVGKYFK